MTFHFVSPFKIRNSAMTYLVLYISSGPYYKQLFVKCSSIFEVYNIHALLFHGDSQWSHLIENTFRFYMLLGGGSFLEKFSFQNLKTGPAAGPISIIYLAKFLFHGGKSIFLQPAYLSLRYADLSGNLHLGFSFKNLIFKICLSLGLSLSIASESDIFSIHLVSVFLVSET